LTLNPVGAASSRDNMDVIVCASNKGKLDSPEPVPNVLLKPAHGVPPESPFPNPNLP